MPNRGTNPQWGNFIIKTILILVLMAPLVQGSQIPVCNEAFTLNQLCYTLEVLGKYSRAQGAAKVERHLKAWQSTVKFVNS